MQNCPAQSSLCFNSVMPSKSRNIKSHPLKVTLTSQNCSQLPEFPFPSATRRFFFNSISNPHPATHSLTPPPLWLFLVSPSPLDFVGPSENSARNNLVTIGIRCQKKSRRTTIFGKNDFWGAKKNRINISGN